MTASPEDSRAHPLISQRRGAGSRRITGISDSLTSQAVSLLTDHVPSVFSAEEVSAFKRELSLIPDDGNPRARIALAGLRCEMDPERTIGILGVHAALATRAGVEVPVQRKAHVVHADPDADPGAFVAEALRCQLELWPAMMDADAFRQAFACVLC
jgi:hypothetical protein